MVVRQAPIDETVPKHLIKAAKDMAMCVDRVGQDKQPGLSFGVSPVFMNKFYF